MIIGFEQITQNLAPTVAHICAELLAAKFRDEHVGSQKLIKNTDLRVFLSKAGHKMSEVQLRQVIHYLRINFKFSDENLNKGYICAKQKGYYLSFNEEENRKYKLSVRQRWIAIKEIDDSMQ